MRTVDVGGECKSINKDLQCSMEPTSKDVGDCDEYRARDNEWVPLSGLQQPRWMHDKAWLERPAGNLSKGMMTTTEESERSSSEEEQSWHEGASEDRTRHTLETRLTMCSMTM